MSSMEGPWILAVDELGVQPEGPEPEVERPENQDAALPASVVDEAAQRDLLESETLAQSGGLAPAARHARHDAPGAAPTRVPEDQRIRGETQGFAALRAYRGASLLAADGEGIGDITDVYPNAVTGEPEWFSAVVPGLRRHTIVVPVRGSYLLDGAVSVPYSRLQALQCELEAGRETLNSDRAEELRRFYGVPRPDVIAAQQAGDITHAP